MKRFTILFSTAAALAVLGAAVSITPAGAALPEMLPGSGFFSGSGKTATFETVTKKAIICKGYTLHNGEFTAVKTAKMNIDFEKCTALGFPANSLGDAAETILATGVELTLCYINSTTKVVGARMSFPTAVHIEIPALALLVRIIGATVGELSPNNTSTTAYKLRFTQTNGAQSQVCEGGARELLVAIDGAAGEGAGLATEAEILFGVAHELMA
jgi:hypothetical protein